MNASIRLTLSLGRALHRYGTPTHQLEDALTLVADALECPGQFFVTPTAIFASFGEGDGEETQLLRAHPGQVNLERLRSLDDVIGAIVRREVDVAEAQRRLDAILTSGDRYGSVPTLLGFTLASATAARFFDGGIAEILGGTAIGLVTGLLALLARRATVVARLFEPTAAFLAAIVASASASIFDASMIITVMAGLIVLIPGLTLTISMIELATGHLVSGTARLAASVLMFVLIAFGVALGTRVGGTFLNAPLAEHVHALPAWTQWLALAVAPFAFTALFRAHPSDVAWIAVSGTLAFLGARAGARLLGPELGTFLGALVVGLASNVIARVAHRPVSVPLVPGIMLLVPGSLGFRSISMLLSEDVVSGVEFAFRMTLVAVALVTGLLLANVVVAPRRAL